MEMPLDPEVIENLKLLQDDDMDVLKEIFESYYHNAEVKIAEISDAIVNRDEKLLSQAAHNLKGGSVTIGAKRVAEICLKLEQRSQRLSWWEIEELLSALKQSYIDVKAQIVQMGYQL